jgi:IMP and pyridine-specific 5'-nucleotidase
MLKRKGRLKEQDYLIEFIMGMHQTHTPVEVMAKMDRWVEEHRYVVFPPSTCRIIVSDVHI